MYCIALTFTTVNVVSLKTPLKRAHPHNGGLRGGKLATVTSLKCELEVKGAKP